MHVSPVGQLREHWGVGVALLAFTGLVALGLSMTLLDEHADAFGFFGIALLLYALLIMSSRLPESWVGSWVAKRLDAWVESHGAGFYGLVALARFVQLEAEDAVAELLTFDLGNFDWSEQLTHHVMGFSMDSLRNLISASIWPAQVFTEWGFLPAAMILGALWGVHSLGTRIFPEAHPVAKGAAGIENAA